ncbi:MULTISPECIES: hypothetical protein [unclassified Streptomyces]|uniref:hypothetical protein n=1 Tax=unclassified Streptomyces TaxID=2593676 RepID=UPI001907E463|nr:hypothetical protein [Streptomyces sp. HSG2]
MDTDRTQAARSGIAAIGLILPSAGSLISLILLPGLYGYGTVFCLMGMGLAVSSVLLPPAQRLFARVTAAIAVLAGLSVIVTGMIQ